MLIAAAYIRVSTEDQIEFSPDSQLKRIQEYAMHHNIQIPKEYIFIDEGISGRNASKRPAFQRMIQLARTGHPFQQILVWKFSRFARNRQDSILYKSMLRKDCGIDVISITEPLNQDPTSILIEALLEAMDEYYSINLAEEVRRGMQERFSRGQAVSVPPFGYQMGKEGFEPRPDQAAWIPIIFQDYACGKCVRDIAAKLNQKGMKTSRGNLFQPRNIMYILNNPVYIGKLRKRCQHSFEKAYAKESSFLLPYPSHDRNYLFTNMEFTEGNHIPLVDQEVWKQVQARLYQEYAGSDIHSPAVSAPSMAGIPCSRVYYLQKMIQCSCCGHYLVQIRKGTAFQCSGYNHGICPESHYIKREHLETLVLETIQPFLSPSASVFLHQASCRPEERNKIVRLVSRKLIYNHTKQQVEAVPEDS